MVDEARRGAAAFPGLREGKFYEMGAVAQSNPVGDNATGEQVDYDANVVLRALILPLRHVADPDGVGAFRVELAMDAILWAAVLKPPLPFRTVTDAT